MKKLKIDYIASALGMAGVFTSQAFEPEVFPKYKEVVTDLTRNLIEGVIDKCKHTNSTIGGLYNAYTEVGHCQELQQLDGMGLDSIYADSGGLQMVTAGKTITPEIKKEIYKTQVYADYAMCFDVIPLSSTSTERTRNERSNISNKIFNQDEHGESGRLTGLNIREQAEYFGKIGAKTKVIIIVQGNSAEDMLLYYRKIAEQLEPSHYANIGGLALADTCMGNGEAESIEMLKAGRLIAKECHDSVKKHVHILGVGSISRMRPIIYLINSGYLSTFEQVSYDSSSHTCCFDYGLLKMNGGCKPLGSTGTPAAVKHFSYAYDLFKSTMKQVCTKDEFLEFMFGDRTRDWKYSTVKQAGFAKGTTDATIAAILTKAVHAYSQIDNFAWNVDNIMNTYSKSQGIESLRNVTDDKTMEIWERHNLNTKFIKSKRINREESISTLEGLWE